MRKVKNPLQSPIYLCRKRVHYLVPRDLPSTSPAPKYSIQIAAASKSLQVQGAGQSKDGEGVTVHLVSSTEPFW